MNRKWYNYLVVGRAMPYIPVHWAYLVHKPHASLRCCVLYPRRHHTSNDDNSAMAKYKLVSCWMVRRVNGAGHRDRTVTVTKRSRYDLPTCCLFRGVTPLPCGQTHRHQLDCGNYPGRASCLNRQPASMGRLIGWCCPLANSSVVSGVTETPREDFVKDYFGFVQVTD